MTSLAVATAEGRGNGSILQDHLGANGTDISAPIPAEIIDSTAERMVVVVIESRAFFRDCIVRSLRSINVHVSVFGFASVADWRERSSQVPNPSVVVICSGSQESLRSTVREECQAIARMERAPAVVVLSGEDDPAEILSILDVGAKGVIPTDVSLDVAFEAIRVVRAGGLIPASSLLSSRRSLEASKGAIRTRGSALLTDRQAAVVEAVKKGKPNKIIAHELNMRESTVKVHIRNIMHKLNARNRTEVAYLYNASASGEEKA